MCRFQSVHSNCVLLTGLLLSLSIRPATSQEKVEFDATFLRGTAQHTLDVSRFSDHNPIPPGEYESDIYVNEEWKGKTRLRFREHEGSTVLCVNETVLSIFDLVPSSIATGPGTKPDSQCTPAAQAVPKARFAYRLDDFRLDVTIPQIYVMQRPRGYINPANWQTGVSTAFLNYDYNYYQSTYSGRSRSNTSQMLHLNGGINLGNWHYRHQGSMSWNQSRRFNDGNHNRYRSYSNYVQRDIPSLRSQIMGGDFTTNGVLFNSFSIRGLQMNSDERMLPDAMRGYAPTVHGIAQSNALVTIKQNANVIYETTVPPGPFAIRDLYPSSYGGDLHVTVTEADGSARTFTVPFNTVSLMLRPGNLQYQLAGGRFRFGTTTLKNKVFQGSLQYGLNNWFTLNAGLNASDRYRSLLLGGAFNTSLGAFGLNSITAHSMPLQGERATGLTWRASYANFIPSTKSNVSLSMSRSPSKGYYSLQNAVLDDNRNVLDRHSWYLLDRQKNQLQVALNQSFAEGWGSAYLSAYATDYWNQNGRDTTFQAGYSNNYRNLSYTVSLSRSRDYFSRQISNNVLLSFSIPLGKDNKHQVTTQTGRSSRSGTYLSSALSGVAGAHNQYAYSFAANRAANNTHANVNGSYRSSYGVLTANAGLGKDYRQVGASASGAIVAHPKGISFSEQVGDTFAIISAPGAEGARVDSGSNARLDSDGLAIVSYLSPYQVNTVGVNPQETSNNVDFEATSQQVIPRANNAMLIELKTKAGAGILFQVKLADGTFPPLGADVLDEAGNAVGFVAQQGYVFVRGPKPAGTLRVRWGTADSAQCSAPYTLKNKSNGHTATNGDLVKVIVQCQ